MPHDPIASILDTARTSLLTGTQPPPGAAVTDMEKWLLRLVAQHVGALRSIVRTCEAQQQATEAGRAA